MFGLRATDPANLGHMQGECDLLCIEIGELVMQKDALLPSNPRRAHIDNLLAEKRLKIDVLFAAITIAEGGDDFGEPAIGHGPAGHHHQDLAA